MHETLRLSTRPPVRASTDGLHLGKASRDAYGRSAAFERSPRRSSDDSGTVESEDAHGRWLRRNLSWTCGGRVGVGGRRLLGPAKAASLFETHLAKPWRTFQ
jgi:hypothetical protein